MSRHETRYLPFAILSMSPLCRWLLKNRLRLAEVLLKKAVDGEIVFLPGHVVRDILIQQVFSKSPLFLQQAEICSRHREHRHRCFTHHEDEPLEYSHVFPMENQRTERKLKEIGKECLHHRIVTRSGGCLSSGYPSPTSGVSPDRNGRKTTRCLIQIALRQHSRLLQM